MPLPTRHYEITVTEVISAGGGSEPKREEALRRAVDAVEPWQAVEKLAEHFRREHEGG
jgi:hypothetical protein